jgi:hypothetical protein
MNFRFSPLHLTYTSPPTDRLAVAMADLHSFLAAINQYVAQQDGLQLAKSLQLPLNRTNIPKLYQQLAQRSKSINVLSYCQSNISDANIAVLVGNILRSLVGICDGKFAEAYASELEAYNALLVCYRDEPSNWMCPVLMVVSNDLRLVAIQVTSLALSSSSCSCSSSSSSSCSCSCSPD